MLNVKNKLFRWGPIDACPLFMYYTIQSSFKNMYNIFGYCYPESVIIFKNKKILWLLDDQDFLDRGVKFTKEHIINSTNKRLLLDKWVCTINKLLKVFKKLELVNLSEIDNKELYDLFDEFSDIYFKFWEIGMTFELTLLALELWLSEKLKNIMKDQKKYNEKFAKLSTLVDLTFYRQEEKELLEIAQSDEKQKEDELKKHQEKYYWILNSYLEAKILDLNYFKNELEKLQKENINQKLNEIENYSKKIKNEKEEIIERLNLDDMSKKWIRLMEEFGIFQDIRKSYNFKADHYLELFAKEIGKRFNLNVDELKLFLPKEIKELIENKLDKNVFQKRRSVFVIHITKDSEKLIIGKEAEKISSDYYVIKKTDEVRVIQGVLASRGKSHYFRGIAKVLSSPKEIDKINEGDILITKMTSPDYIIAMKKAGAVVTDEGGILCHAAIVSRELGISCIVGTKVATKMIKDGDVIEIHNGKGTVKIIEKPK